MKWQNGEFISLFSYRNLRLENILSFWRIRPKEVNAHFPAGGFKLKVIRFFFCMLRVLFILFAKNLSYMLHCILIIKSFASFKYLSWKTFSVSSCPYVQKKYSLSRAICLCLIVRIKRYWRFIIIYYDHI